MLFLVLQVGDDRYAIEASQAIEVLPLVEWKRMPHGPAGVLGFLNYHGKPVPLVDLAALMFGRSSQRWMSTRIVIVKNCSGPGESELLGLLAEQITETKRLDEADFDRGRVAIAKAPYLDAVAASAEGMVQRIDVSRLLSDEVRAQLFLRTAFEKEAVEQ